MAKEREEKVMKKTITIIGMKCEGCATTVKKAIEKLSDVTGVTINIEEKRATIESTREVSIEEVKKALSDTKFIVE